MYLVSEAIPHLLAVSKPGRRIEKPGMALPG
jgi:hypothetical protein